MADTQGSVLLALAETVGYKAAPAWNGSYAHMKAQPLGNLS